MIIVLYLIKDIKNLRLNMESEVLMNSRYLIKGVIVYDEAAPYSDEEFEDLMNRAKIEFQKLGRY